jgi:putative glutamine amidotransferase
MWKLIPALLEARSGVDTSPHPVHGERQRPRLDRWWHDEASLIEARAQGQVPVLTVAPRSPGAPTVLVTMDRHGPAGSGVARIGRAYPDAVLAAGGWPLLVPPGEPSIEALLNGADALVITGGAFDIHPHHYGQAVAARIDRVEEARTRLELALARAALLAHLPVLGVCGGMQALAVAAGGTLIQDLPLRPTHEQPTAPSEPWHRVAATGPLALALGPELAVNSTHHQAVDEPGALFAVVGRSEDGVIEAIWHTGHPFAVGVQWHPELLHDTRLYEGLVAAARR